MTRFTSSFDRLACWNSSSAARILQFPTFKPPFSMSCIWSMREWSVLNVYLVHCIISICIWRLQARFLILDKQKYIVRINTFPRSLKHNFKNPLFFLRNLWLISHFHRNIRLTIDISAHELLVDTMQRAERGRDKYMEMEHSLCTINWGSEWGWGSTCGCRLKFHYLLGFRLKFSPFVASPR